MKKYIQIFILIIIILSISGNISVATEPSIETEEASSTTEPVSPPDTNIEIPIIEDKIPIVTENPSQETSESSNIDITQENTTTVIPEQPNINIIRPMASTIEVSISTSSINFGTVIPETQYTLNSAMVLTIQSSATYVLSYTASNFETADGFYTFPIGSLEDTWVGSGNTGTQPWLPVVNTNPGISISKGRRTHTYSYRLTVPPTAEPGLYTSVITYSVLIN